MTKLGILVGSAPFNFRAQRMNVDVNTPWGPASEAPHGVKVGNDELYLVRRHGIAQDLNPHQVNYRANVWMLNQIGVSAVIGTHTVGGIDSSLEVGQLVLPDQIIDYTWGRAQTYDDKRRHAEFSFPYDALMREYLIGAYAGVDSTLPMMDGGVYGCTQGPRLETAAEIERMRRDGCTIVGMTGMPEAALARELDLPYVSICVVVNPAAGIGTGEINIGALQAASRAGAKVIEELLLAFLRL